MKIHSFFLSLFILLSSCTEGELIGSKYNEVKKIDSVKFIPFVPTDSIQSPQNSISSDSTHKKKTDSPVNTSTGVRLLNKFIYTK